MAGNTGPNIAEQGLILYYDTVNSKSYISGSNTIYDLSGNNNHGVIYTASFFDINGIPSLNFSSSGGFISCSRITLNYYEQFSIEYTSYIPNPPMTSQLLPIGESSITDTFLKYETAPSRLFGRYTGSTAVFITNTGASIITGSFNISGIINNNGIAWGISNGIIGTTSGSSLSSLILDRLCRAQLGVTNIRLVGIKIYNKVLTSNQVLENYNAMKGRFKL